MFNAGPVTPTVASSPLTPPFKAAVLTANASSFVTPAPSSARRKTIYDDYSSTFSSTRTPQSRRSIIEISKDVLSQRIQNLNRITEAQESRNKHVGDSVVPPPDSFEEFMNQYSTPKNISQLDVTPNLEKATATSTSEGVQKKRRLFTPPHLMPTPSGVHVLGMKPRASLNDSDCFNVIDEQVPMEQQSEVHQEPEMELKMQTTSTTLLRQVSVDLENPTPAKRRRLKSEKVNPKLMTEKQSGVNEEPEVELGMQKSSTTLLRQVSDDLGRATPAKRPRLKPEKVNPKLMTPARPRRRSTMLPLN